MNWRNHIHMAYSQLFTSAENKQVLFRQYGSHMGFIQEFLPQQYFGFALSFPYMQKQRDPPMCSNKSV